MKKASCPKCNQELTRKNYLEDDTRCQCGWSANEDQLRQEARSQEVIAFKLLFVGLLFMGLITSSLYVNTPDGEIEYLKLKDRAELSQAIDHKRLAILCMQKEENTCALEQFKKAIGADPTYAEALVHIARINREEGNLEESMEFYFEYLESPDANIDRLIEVADTLNAIGKLEQAIKMYQQAIEDVDGLVNVSATKGLVRLYLSSGKKSKAIQAIRKFDQRTQSGSEFFSKELMTLRNM